MPRSHPFRSIFFWALLAFQCFVVAAFAFDAPVRTAVPIVLFGGLWSITCALGICSAWHYSNRCRYYEHRILHCEAQVRRANLARIRALWWHRTQASHLIRWLAVHHPDIDLETALRIAHPLLGTMAPKLILRRARRFALHRINSRHTTRVLFNRTIKEPASCQPNPT